MATHAHCIVCFDALYSDLVRHSLPSWTANDKKVKADYDAAKETWRRPLSLAEVDKSWSLYKSQNIKRLPALERLAQTAASAGASSDSSGASTPVSTSGSGSSSTSLLPGSSSGGSAAGTPATSTTSLPDDEPITESPLFVTWDTKTRHGKELRGCIGTFETLPLDEGLPSYARTSAFDDHRFDRVQFPELPSLVVSVTLLTNFEPCAGGWDDWEVGRHGIKIRVQHNGRSYSATYLPQVAEEQEWDHEQTLSSLMRKAGFRGDWKKVKFDTVRYEGKKVEMEWAEYKAWRDWDDARCAGQKAS